MAISATHFVHVDRDEHLDLFIKEKIEEVVSSFKHNGKYSLDVWISKVRGETDYRGPHFLCEASLKVDGGESPILIKKADDSFYVAVEEVGFAIKNVLTKRSRCKGRQEHRQFEKVAIKGHEL